VAGNLGDGGAVGMAHVDEGTSSPGNVHLIPVQCSPEPHASPPMAGYPPSTISSSPVAPPCPRSELASAACLVACGRPVTFFFLDEGRGGRGRSRSPATHVTSPDRYLSPAARALAGTARPRCVAPRDRSGTWIAPERISARGASGVRSRV
jgi:hypothetical protein